VLNTPTDSQRVADHLREQILSGAIAPGERIRQEDIAEFFGLSRLPEDMAPEAVRTVQELQQILGELRIELCGANQGT